MFLAPLARCLLLALPQESQRKIAAFSIFPARLCFGDACLDLHFWLETLAFVVGFRYYLYLRKGFNDPISSDHRLYLLAGAAGGAWLGSRMLGLLEDPLYWRPESFQWTYLLTVKTVAGGLLGGLAGVEGMKRRIGLKARSGDLFTYPILLAMVIGRVGCFLAGVTDGTHGSPTDLAWGLDMGDGVPRHPAQLYEIIFLLALWLGLRRLEGRMALAAGARFQLFMVAYLLFRFFVEFIKPVYVYPFGFSAIQVACLAGLVYYWQIFFRPRSLIIPKVQAADPISSR